MLQLSAELGQPLLRAIQGREEIFDPCRRKWVALTPEEWVRQRLLLQFTEALQIPAAWIAVEKEIVVNGLRKRYDVLVHDASGNPWIMVECKAPDVWLGQSVWEQLLRYHIRIPVPYLIITNGEETHGWEKTPNGMQELISWPKPGN